MQDNEEHKINKKANQILDKILKNNDMYLVFGLSTCGYCKKTINFLQEKNLQFKYYEMDKYYEIFVPILEKLIEIGSKLEIDPEHRTFPIIFYNQKFIGGYTDLIKINQ